MGYSGQGPNPAKRPFLIPTWSKYDFHLLTAGEMRLYDPLEGRERRRFLDALRQHRNRNKWEARAEYLPDGSIKIWRVK